MCDVRAPQKKLKGHSRSAQGFYGPCQSDSLDLHELVMTRRLVSGVARRQSVLVSYGGQAHVFKRLVELHWKLAGNIRQLCDFDVR